MTRRANSPLTCPPLYGTARSPDRLTLGPRVGEIAALLGRPFKPWQQYVADVAGEIDPETGRLAYSEVCVIGPRQIGKTELLLPEMTHRCVGFEQAGPQRVLYTAQTADAARMKWRDVHQVRLLAVPTLSCRMTPRLRQNSEAFMWANGSMWSPGSTTGKTAGTGDTLDMGVIDEAWSRADSRTELAMRPAMLTRPWRQLWVLSMIPGLSRAMPGTWPYLKGKRQVGRARVDADVRQRMAFFDFAAADGLDPGDPATWWTCHPALGHTIDEKAIAEDFEAMELVDFCAEYLGWEPLETTPRWMLIRETTWSGLRDPDSSIDGPLALSVEITDDRTHGVICAAGKRADGHWHGEVVEPGHRVPEAVHGTDWMLRRVLDLVEAQQPATVVIDPRRPAASLIVPLRNAGVDVLTPNQMDIAGACGRFYDATGDSGDPDDSGLRVFHLGQPELDRALAQGKRLDTGSGGAFTFVKRGGTANLTPLYGVVLAMHGFDVKAAAKDYDVLDSVDSSRPCGRCGLSLYADGDAWLHAADDSPQC